MRTLFACHLLLLGGTSALVCCTDSDPYVRPGQWKPLGANDLNLRAMVADPADLDRGRGATASLGDEAAAAVLRLRLDAVRPLPASGLSDVKLNDSGAQQPGASPATPASLPVAPAATASPTP